MKTFITLFILFISLTLFQSEVFSKTIKQQVAEIDKKINRINQMTFDRMNMDFPPDVDYTTVSTELGGLKVTFYRDRKSKKIRKLTYHWISATYESGSYLIEYFDAKGHLILVLYRYWVYDIALADMPFWRIYFANRKLIKAVSGVLHNNKGQIQVLRTRKMLDDYFKTIKDLNMSLLKDIKKDIHQMTQAKSKNKQEMAEYRKTIVQYKSIKNKILKQRYTGRFSFRAPKKSDGTMINDSPVVVRAGGSIKSKVLFHLYIGDQIIVLSVGKRESIGKWGKYNWYKVKTADGKSGWVFGAFLEPVEVKLK